MKAFFLTLLVAMVPIIELRGAIPIGMAYGLNYWPALIAGIVGNLLPIPFIIVFIEKIFAWLRTKSPKLEALVSKLEKRAEAKMDKVEKYEFWGLMLFVGIPLPGTGAWTGALIAAMMNMPMKKAFPAIALGVLLAGIIVSLLSLGVLELIF